MGHSSLSKHRHKIIFKNDLETFIHMVVQHGRFLLRAKELNFLYLEHLGDFPQWFSVNCSESDWKINIE